MGGGGLGMNLAALHGHLYLEPVLGLGGGGGTCDLLDLVLFVHILKLTKYKFLSKTKRSHWREFFKLLFINYNSKVHQTQEQIPFCLRCTIHVILKRKEQSTANWHVFFFLFEL